MSALLHNGPEAIASTPSAGGWSVRDLDPRVRILVVCAFAATVVNLNAFPILGTALGFSLVALFSARLPLGKTLKRVMMMDTFVVFMLFLLPFTMPGETAFTVFSFAASWEGIFEACRIALKANAIVMMVLALVGTMEAVTLGHALSRLRVPEILIHLMLFTIRYIEVLNDEQKRMRVAMKARGFRPSNNIHTYKTFGYLVGMLLVRALERSERILKAMKCRGFQGKLYLLDDMTCNARDYIFAGMMIAIIVVLLSWEYLNVPFV
ncbi:cobalt ECF transporter T component CbiQ [Aestuariispira insulae]|uniref:Cobalt/nickel transport system permease protein n=1 Tax=Aestuariispira insulae TaxID=1461337 RepID=A0A3D9HXR2_9PROT|nr:cobalt ECF transporter T component CbiQ [Aestuariispira insulae]RED53686.1 cobalt/nickel transport system permease protein [Aestuariispira insulae]